MTHGNGTGHPTQGGNTASQKDISGWLVAPAPRPVTAPHHSDRGLQIASVVCDSRLLQSGCRYL